MCEIELFYKKCKKILKIDPEISAIGNPNNAKILDTILEKLENCDFCDTLSLCGQEIDDETLKKIIKMLKNNTSIKILNLGGF